MRGRFLLFAALAVALGVSGGAGRALSVARARHFDRTPPAAVTGLNLTHYDAETHEAWVSWDPDFTPGSNVGRWQYRIRLDNRGWSTWATTSEIQTDGNGLPAFPGQMLCVQVAALDEAGSPGPSTELTVTIPAQTETLGGSGEIDENAAGDGPAIGPPEFPDPTSTPEIAVPQGATPAAHYERSEWDPGDTEANVFLYGVASTSPGTFALSGLVIDAASGHPVAGASVELVAGGATATTTTESNGGYAFAEMPPSQNVRLSVSAAGFAPYAEDGLPFRADDEYLWTVELKSST